LFSKNHYKFGVARVAGLIIGLFVVYFSFELGIDGRFTFKGSLYSSQETPILFWLQVIGFFLIGAYLVIYPFISEHKGKLNGEN
jgi:hypothetical protein